MSESLETTDSIPTPEQLDAEASAIRANPLILNNLPAELPFGSQRAAMKDLLPILERATGLSPEQEAHWRDYKDRGLARIADIDGSIQQHGISLQVIERLQTTKADDSNPAAQLEAIRELVELIEPVYRDLRQLGYSYNDLTGKVIKSE